MPAPAWITITISMLSLVLAFAAFRLGGPSLRGSAVLGSYWQNEPFMLNVKLWNRGRGAITITSIAVGLWIGRTLIQIPLRVDNPVPPVRVEGHSGEEWQLDCGDYTERLQVMPLDSQLRVHVILGNGKQRSFRVKIEDAEALLQRKLRSPEEYQACSEELWGKAALDVARAVSKAMPGQELRVKSFTDEFPSLGPDLDPDGGSDK